MKYLVMIIVLLLCGCTEPDEARRVLHQQGYTNIQITGYQFFGCSDSDAFHTGFIAKAPSGTQVEGVVCSGWMKGHTVRFN